MSCCAASAETGKSEWNPYGGCSQTKQPFNTVTTKVRNALIWQLSGRKRWQVDASKSALQLAAKLKSA